MPGQNSTDRLWRSPGCAVILPDDLCLRGPDISLFWTLSLPIDLVQLTIDESVSQEFKSLGCRGRMCNITLQATGAGTSSWCTEDDLKTKILQGACKRQRCKTSSFCLPDPTTPSREASVGEILMRMPSQIVLSLGRTM